MLKLHTKPSPTTPDAGGTVTEWLQISEAYETIINKKHKPIITTADTQMLNIALDIKQQTQGIDDYIQVEQEEELFIKIKILLRCISR